VPEVGASQRPLAAAEMALVRLAYAADLPTPDEALRSLREGLPTSGVAARNGSPPPTLNAPGTMRSSPPSDGGGAALARAPAPILAAAPSPTVALRRFEDVVALAGERRDIVLKGALERDVRLVRFEDGHIEFALAEGGSRSLPNDLSRALADWTGRRWAVVLSSKPGEPTIAERKRAHEAERRSDAESHPLVRAVLASFPGAAIVDVRDRGAAQADTAAAEGGIAPPPDEDDSPDDV
jgi:DNA polymerase-3 subunit gamma/tau